MRTAGVALATLLVAVAAVAGERFPQTDETQVFTGGEEVQAGRSARPPQVRYWKVRASLRVAAGAPVRATMLVPLSDGRQDVLVRRTVAPGFRVRELEAGPNLRVEWTTERTAGSTLTYDVAVRIVETAAPAPHAPLRALVVPPEAAGSLAATAMVQSGAPEVMYRAGTIVGSVAHVDDVVATLEQYVAAFLPATDPPGPQDALSVLGARRGTSLGRARALAALLRAEGIPARLVGGLRLENTTGKRATNSWVEAWTGERWTPLDPAGGHAGTLPTTYLALYRGDLPLIVHTAGVDVAYAFDVRESTRRAVEEGDDLLEAVTAPVDPRRAPAETHAAYVTDPIASVVVLTDESVPAAAADRILSEARAAAIDCVLLTARFDSRYFRETYLERLIAANLPLLRRAHLILVATADDAGLQALLTLGAHGVRLPDARVVAAGAMARPTARMLGSLLWRLVGPGEVVIEPRSADLLAMWEMARANLVDGVPMREEATRWGLDPVVLGVEGVRLPAWRRPIRDAWARIIAAGVPLPTLTLILVLPLIATIAVAARVLIGVETFGIFGPVIVSLAFVATGLRWGIVTYAVIVGLGVVLRRVLQALRLQAVARLAILIALVAGVMGGLTALGAVVGVGPLLNLGVFPMVIMSNVIEQFGSTQSEMGTAAAVRRTLGTLAIAVACWFAIDRGGLQSLIVAFPEILLAAVAIDVLLGKWRGMRLLELLRFARGGLTPPPAAPDVRAS